MEAFKSAIDSIQADYQYFAYPGVKHSFTSKEADANGKKFDMPLEYNEDADKKSWASLQALFAEVFNWILFQVTIITERFSAVLSF